MIVDVLTGPAGAGKTQQLLERAARTTGRYLFAATTTALADEQARRFAALAPKDTCLPIHSRTRAREPVRRRIENLAKTYSAGQHVAAFITHESLKSANFDAFESWHACLDEIVDSVTVGTFIVSTGVAAFEDTFTLEPMEGVEWSRLVPTGPSQSWTENANDALWHNLADFCRLAARGEGVFINVTNWSQCRAGGRVKWFSIWTPLELKSFASVTIAGAGFETSVGYLVIRSTYPELQFIISHIAAARTAQPQIRIGYFTKAPGSTSFWTTSDGRYVLVQIERWLSSNLPKDCFWSGNEVVRNQFEHRIQGTMTTPKLAGLNQHRHATSCVFIYSSKCVPQDATLRDIFELSAGEIRAAREDEDVFQYVSRGAIRDPDYGGAYEVLLYDLPQAERLKARLVDAGFAEVELHAIDEAGVMDIKRAAPARATVPTAIEAADRLTAKRLKATTRQRRFRERKKAKQSETKPALKPLNSISYIEPK